MAQKRGKNNSFNNKKLNSSLNKTQNESILNMFKRIESNDSNSVKCEYCKLLIKSCLLKDHVNTKCEVKMKLSKIERIKKDENDESDIICLDDDINENENKKLKISPAAVYKFEIKNTIDFLNFKEENLSCQSTPRKASLNSSIFSIFDNDEERSKYVKDEKTTPIKNEIFTEDQATTLPPLVEKTHEEKIIVSDEDAQFETEKLIINVITDSETITIEDKKLTHIQESSLRTPKKQNVAKKSTSNCKYNNNFKENIEQKEHLPSSTSSSNEDLMNKLDKEEFFEELELADNLSTENQSISNPNICYALKNFVNVIETVLDDKNFVYLLNDNDIQVVNTFYDLTDDSKKLFVRLFQRKYKWIQYSNINYEYISNDIQPLLDELKNKSFIKDENTIEDYEEIIDLFKIPQLKQLVKQFHIVNTQTVPKRLDYINAILKHFKTQKRLNFGTQNTNETENVANVKYMNFCKNLLGKSYKLDKCVRDVFVRILMLYSLTSTHHMSQNNLDSGQSQLFQILMVNMGKLKFMKYVISLDKKIYKNRDSFINYQAALEYEFILIDFIENKEFEKAYEEFEQKLYIFKLNIKNETTKNDDLKLPNYLRKFSANSIYCKILSIYAMEILQRMKFYKQANELFEFLLFEQDLYLLDYRYHWYERLAINYETHLKDPYRAMEILELSLNDKENVRKAGRLALYQRALKMSQIKKYSKIENLAVKLKVLCENEYYEIDEATINQIEGNLLQPEIIPGRKTIFVQSSSSTVSSKNSKNFEICSVEQIAMSYYMKNYGYTHGKHAETISILTIFGLIFWDILFESSIPNVFIDRFQTTPLDLNTDNFYLDRKHLIDEKIIYLKENKIESIIDSIEEIWYKYEGTQCLLVNWEIFENFDEFKSLLNCFTNEKLASLCEYISKNYRYCRSGGPDLILWSVINKDIKFVEVKGPGDKLSYKQIVWLDFLKKMSINCEVCYVKGTCSKRLREFE